MDPVTTPTNIVTVCAVIGLALKVWRDDRRQQREAAERRETHQREAEERREQAEQASKERRLTNRHLRNLRPDSYCAARGCPLTDGPMREQPKPPHQLRAA